ncbi:AMP-binding protein [Fodinicola feengrottensis]|uniref:AMP-dependent synthetase/ligase domain-containing protein n=1 Tax=Fodinicola feengrottensis TaxID=435914 RepID=A0ABN2JBQ4_9ACTN|nr:AMP-binding protein [Fodinicola feengrottensis]
MKSTTRGQELHHELLSRGRPAADAIVVDGVRVTYRELRSLVTRAASDLSRPFHLLPKTNGIPGIAQYLACQRDGVTAVAYPTGVDDATLRRTVVRLAQSAADEPLPDGTALLMPTSGSTGAPGWVATTYDNLLANCRAVVSRLKLHSGLRVYSHLPLSYCFALSVLNTHLQAGATFVTSSAPFGAPAAYDAVVNLGCNGFAGVPSMYEALQVQGFFTAYGKKLVHLQHTGGALRNRTVRQLADAVPAGAKFYAMYGQTEATARIAAFDVLTDLSRAGSVGPVLDGFEATLRPAQPGEDHGELVLTGPSVTPLTIDPTGDRLVRSSLATGDIVRMDADRHLSIVGRTSTVIKVAGMRVHAETIEQALADRGVSGYLVAFAVPDPAYGERVGVAVCGSAADRDKVARAAALALPPALNPAHVWTLPTIPMTDSGKVRRAEVRAQCLRGAAAGL